MPLANTLTALKYSEYDGFLSIEWEKKWHPELAEPEVALPQHLAELRRVASQIGIDYAVG